jgi:hypothetical protein
LPNKGGSVGCASPVHTAEFVDGFDVKVSIRELLVLASRAKTIMDLGYQRLLGRSLATGSSYFSHAYTLPSFEPFFFFLGSIRGGNSRSTRSFGPLNHIGHFASSEISLPPLYLALAVTLYPWHRRRPRCGIGARRYSGSPVLAPGAPLNTNEIKCISAIGRFLTVERLPKSK